MQINLPCNLLLLCNDCHTEIESNRSIALDLGRLVRRNHDPGEVPVLLQRGWTRLNHEGTYLDP